MDEDEDTLVERLLKELRQKDAVLTEVKTVLYGDERVQHLTVIGGVRALIRMRDEAEEQVVCLEKEIQKMIRSSK